MLMSGTTLSNQEYAGGVTVQWYSGDKMIDNFFSKPLSGQKFLRFRRKIMDTKKIKTP